MDAVAAVIREMVAQRKELLDLVQRQLGMMQQMHSMHMMQQMQMGGRGASVDEQP